MGGFSGAGRQVELVTVGKEIEGGVKEEQTEVVMVGGRG